MNGTLLVTSSSVEVSCGSCGKHIADLTIPAVLLLKICPFCGEKFSQWQQVNSSSGLIHEGVEDQPTLEEMEKDA